MTIQSLLRDLENYQAFDDNEAEMLREVIDFIRQFPERCCDRSLRSGHITGSAWILDIPNRQVLLTHHRKLNRWLQLGGHADGDTDILGVAQREAKEESGLDNIQILLWRPFDVDVHMIPERHNEPAHFHYDIRYLLAANSRDRLVVSSESNMLQWIGIDSLAASAHGNSPSINRLVAKTSVYLRDRSLDGFELSIP